MVHARPIPLDLAGISHRTNARLVDNPIAMFAGMLPVAPVSAGVRDLRCRRSEESVSVGLG